MGFVIGFLTFVMVLDSLAMILLVLIQLPKKDAGAGLAFGGTATDALFGAGSGNVLTKITKYAAGTFFVLAIVLSVLQSQYHLRSTAEFKKLIDQPGPGPSATTPRSAPAPATPVAPAVVPAPATNLLTVKPQVESTNIPAAAPNAATAPAPKK
ncbi:MAG: preprotein translocase subunit SecG [Verrucomicrobiota bacterium]